jgi:glycerol kinase
MLMGLRGEVFSTKFTTDKRTYFFNIKENRYGDLFLNIVESKKNTAEGFERQSVIVFDEDLQGFVAEFQKSLDFIKKSKKK